MVSAVTAVNQTAFQKSSRWLSSFWYISHARTLHEDHKNMEVTSASMQ